MDSLTQITLGAAVGELVLGRKIGNKAMLWGAIGGTIPDLDVFARVWMNEIDALAVHRGFSHSILFASLAPFLLGFLVDRFYQRGYHQLKGVRWAFFSLWLLFYSAISLGMTWLFREASPLLVGGMMVTTGAGGVLLARHWWRDYLQRASDPPEATYADWVKLFFWAILTHPLLDAFTAYGTQLFVPFSDYRVAFNVVAIVDPIYTVPFLAAVILASTMARDSRLRYRVNMAGLVWSTGYLMLCTLNKQHIDRVFQRSLEAQGIQAHRFSASPTIFNNLLWQGVAETDSTYYLGMYSLMDSSALIQRFETVPRQQEIPEATPDDHALRILRWFTKGYYYVIPKGDGHYVFNDLRYGAFGGEGPIEERFIFSFDLRPGPNGFEATQVQPEDQDMGKIFQNLWRRMMGQDLVAERRGRDQS
ncbi:MAG: metal-dependent hydrolase [Lewinellaceae bacterium]|nr:metal-dependent hydrolase [Saprospiraceae bacterium]MCB9313956.1 metal-dependent hydrolase [Lewinellaceae bacterium]HRW76511.1 metal-dependent hydrolase [Saprospiraceae bacterium]